MQQGLRSTRWTTAANALLAANASKNLLPSTELFDTLTAPTDTLIFREVPIATLFTDDLGRFPVRAMRGNQYIMLAYHDAANVILVQPFKSKSRPASHPSLQLHHETSHGTGHQSGRTSTQQQS